MENSMEARVSASKNTFKHIYVNATLKLALFLCKYIWKTPFLVGKRGAVISSSVAFFLLCPGYLKIENNAEFLGSVASSSLSLDVS